MGEISDKVMTGSGVLDLNCGKNRETKNNPRFFLFLFLGVDQY